MVSPKQQVEKLLAEYGADWLDSSQSNTELIGSAWSPPGKAFTATGNHCIAVNFYTDRPAGWKSLLADLKLGIEACDQADCENCQTVNSERP